MAKRPTSKVSKKTSKTPAAKRVAKPAAKAPAKPAAKSVAKPRAAAKPAPRAPKPKAAKIKSKPVAKSPAQMPIVEPGLPMLRTNEVNSRPVTKSDPAKTRAFAIDAARMLADDKCEDVQLLDVRGKSQVSDYIIIASGTSDRQMSSSGDDLHELAAKHGWSVFRRHDDDRRTWIIVDFVDVVAHIFEPNTRAHYDLEMMWADAPRVEWERADQVKRDRAGLS